MGGRLLEAGKRLPKREPGQTRCNGARPQALDSVTGPPVRAVSAWPPRRSRPLLLVGGHALDLAGKATRWLCYRVAIAGGQGVRRGTDRLPRLTAKGIAGTRDRF